MTMKMKSSKKNKKRFLQLFAYLLIIFSLSWFFESQATTTYLLIRHADLGITSGGSNPPLSMNGYQQSLSLADRLRDIDVVAGLNQIYTDQSLRSIETATPLAQALNIDIQTDNLSEVEPFISKTLRAHKGEIIMIVGDAEVIPPLVEELHGSKNLPRNDELNFNQLYIVTVPWFGKVKTLRINL